MKTPLTEHPRWDHSDLRAGGDWQAFAVGSGEFNRSTNTSVLQVGLELSGMKRQSKPWLKQKDRQQIWHNEERGKSH